MIRPHEHVIKAYTVWETDPVSATVFILYREACVLKMLSCFNLSGPHNELLMAPIQKLLSDTLFTLAKQGGSVNVKIISDICAAAVCQVLHVANLYCGDIIQNATNS